MNPLLLDLVYLALCLLGLPYIIYKTVTSKRFRAGWCERLGRVPVLPPRHRIWVHCASVGEVLLARTLIDELHAQCPQSDIVISTNTSTGREMVRKHLPGHTAFYFPLDISLIISRVLRRIKPSAVVLVELEQWPNFITVAWRKQLPLVVVNGRMTQRTLNHYRWFGAMADRQFAKVRHFAVQNEEYAKRIEALKVGRDRITVTGTMKYDVVATEAPVDAIETYSRLFRLRADETVVFGGCTHPGEDESLIDYVKQRQVPEAKLRLILAPRHCERADAVEKLITAAGLLAVRKTALDAGRAPEGFWLRPHVILIDTTGELARLYAVATVVFVGGSLVEHGGHNMIEPAALGKAVVFGPHTWNFRDTVEMLTGAQAAIRVDGPDELARILDALVGDPARRRELGARAQALVEQNKGATKRNVEAIKPFLALPAPEC